MSKTVATERGVTDRYWNDMESTSLLNALANINESLIDLHFCFRSNPRLKTARHGFDLRKSGLGFRADMYVEADVAEDVSYCWWLELAVDNEGWTLKAVLLKDSENGQKVLANLGESNGSSTESLLAAIQVAGEDVVRSGKSFEFGKN